MTQKDLVAKSGTESELQIKDKIKSLVKTNEIMSNINNNCKLSISFAYKMLQYTDSLHQLQKSVVPGINTTLQDK